MTITSQTSSTTVIGNGVQTAFAYNFFVPGQTTADQTYFQVYVTDTSGNVTTLTTSQYSVVNSLSKSSPGGTLTYSPIAGPLALNWTITISRVLPFTQLVTLANQGGFYPDVVDAALDTLELQIQQVDAAVTRVIQAPASDSPSIHLALPAAAARASKLLGFDSSGNVIATTSVPTGGSISSAMAPVCAASTIAIARSDLGLGAMALEGIGGGLADDGAGNARVTLTTASVSTNQSVASANFLQQYIVTATATFTLPKVTTLWSGFGFWVFAAGGNAILTPNAADTIQGQSSGTSLTIANGGQAWVTTDGVSKWEALYVPPSATVTTPALASAQGLVIKNNAGTPNTSIDVTVTQAVLINTSGLGYFYTGGTSTIDLTSAGAVNKLDTGTIAASTWYYIYLISNGTNTGGLASTSSTSPTLPSGYTYFMRVGAMLTDGSVHLYGTYQKGRRASYTASLLSLGAAGSITYATFFPPTSESAFISSSAAGASAGTLADMNSIVIATLAASSQVLTSMPNTGGTTFTTVQSSGTMTFSAEGWIDGVNAF